VGFWGYYSPFLIGIALTFLQSDSIFRQLDLWAALPTELRWAAVAALSLLAGAACQLLMAGAQGAFAQVLPVPFGRSLRGRPAVVSGAGLLTGVGLLGAAVLLQSPEFPALRNGLAGLGGASLLIALGAYLWGLPAAVRDFDLRRTETE
jgi:hypothetical protein